MQHTILVPVLCLPCVDDSSADTVKLRDFAGTPVFGVARSSLSRQQAQQANAQQHQHQHALPLAGPRSDTIDTMASLAGETVVVSILATLSKMALQNLPHASDLTSSIALRLMLHMESVIASADHICTTIANV